MPVGVPKVPSDEPLDPESQKNKKKKPKKKGFLEKSIKFHKSLPAEKDLWEAETK